MENIGHETPEGQGAVLPVDAARLAQTAASPQALLHLLSVVLNLVREAAYLIDEDARFLYVNDEACRSLGYDRDEALTLRVMDIDPEWTDTRWREAWDELRAKGSLLVESTHRRKDGLTVPVEITASYFEHGGRAYNLALVRDITERRRAEGLALAQFELEAQFRRLAESTPDIICRYDRQCRLVYANPGLAAIIGRPVQDMLGATPTGHTDDPQFAAYEAAIAATLATGESRTLELVFGAHGCDLRYHHVRITAERGPHEEITGVLAIGRDITERRNAEERLYASEQAFRALVEHSPDYIARYDLAFRRVYANPALLALLAPAEVRTRGVAAIETSPITDIPGYVDRLRHVVETGAEWVDEVRFRNRQGELRWGHMRMVPEFAPDGRVATVLAICRDIDGLKRSEERFRTLAENFPDPLVRFDSECRYLYVNPRVSATSGVSQDAFVGRRIGEMSAGVNGVQTRMLEDGIREVFATGEARGLETHWATNGVGRIYEARHIPEKDAEGKVVSVLTVARDITPLRTAELAARASETAFRTLAENAPEMIVRYDRSGRHAYVNPRFEAVCGVAAEDALGKTPAELPGTAMPELPAITTTLEEVMASGVGTRFDLTWERDGKPVGWHVSAVPERDAGGDIRGALTIWTDITERLYAEHQLRDSYALLQELTSRRETAREEERKRIARELHDELGQHLTALRMGVSALRLEFAPHHPVLAERCQYLLGLADDTIGVVRNVVASLRPAALDAGIVAALEWLAAELARDGRIRCRLRVPDDSLVLDEALAVALFRIVQEALTNVVRHASAEQVTISLAQANDDWVLEVRDDGRGFDSTTVREKSFGLVGMRERALMLGGDISIASARGCGTSVAVRIPMNGAQRIRRTD